MKILFIGDVFGEIGREMVNDYLHRLVKDKEIDYINNKGLDVIRNHAYDFITKRLSPAVIVNDGKQTPMRGHPVFIAQHATATCCRGCLEKWHHISKNRKLAKDEITYIVNVIMEWIKRQLNDNSKKKNTN